MTELQTFSGFGYAKAFVFGEYAVLHQAPALIVALDNKLSSKITYDTEAETPKPTRSNAVTNSSPLQKESEAFAHHIVQQLVNNELHPREDKKTPKLSIDAKSFFDSKDQKLGIGASAASVIAAIDAASKWQKVPIDLLDGDSPSPWLQRAIEIHRNLQSSRGSGADVIASALGGAVLVENCPDDAKIERIKPENLPYFCILASHCQASTGDYLSAAEAASENPKYISAIEALTTIDQRLANYIRDGKGRNVDFLESIDASIFWLEELQEAIALPILTEAFYELKSVAKTMGVVIKPSGAGGGDIFIALAKDKASIDSFVKAIPRELEISVLNAHIAPTRHKLNLEVITRSIADRYEKHFERIPILISFAVVFTLIAAALPLWLIDMTWTWGVFYFWGMVLILLMLALFGLKLTLKSRLIKLTKELEENGLSLKDWRECLQYYPNRYYASNTYTLAFGKDFIRASQN